MLTKRMHSSLEIIGPLRHDAALFFTEQTLSCKFRQGQRGQVPPGLRSWHKRWEQKTLKFRGSPLNTDACWYSSRLYGLWQEPDPQMAELQPQMRLQFYFFIFLFYLFIFFKSLNKFEEE